MMRRVMMALTAVVVVTAGSASTATAMHGGGGHGGGGQFGGGHFGHPGMMGQHQFDGHFLNRGFRHHFVGNRFFFGVGYPYGYYDGCYMRVWTGWGWQWQYACY
jgi:hypothetical protein